MIIARASDERPNTQNAKTDAQPLANQLLQQEQKAGACAGQHDLADDVKPKADNSQKGSSTFRGRAANGLSKVTWKQLYYEWAFDTFGASQRATQELSQIFVDSTINKRQLFIRFASDLDRQQEVTFRSWLLASGLLWQPAIIPNIAYQMWEYTGWQKGVALDTWLAAEKYVGSITAAATRMVTSSSIDREVLFALIEAFPPYVYYEQIARLAELMWEYTDLEYQASAVALWTAAERHILIIVGAVMSSATSTMEAMNTLVKIFQEFSPRAHLQRIREKAYGMWEDARRPYGQTLDLWVQAEKQLLDQILQGLVPVLPPA